MKYFCFLKNFNTGKFRNFMVNSLYKKEEFDMSKIEDTRYFNNFIRINQINIDNIYYNDSTNIDKSFEKSYLRNFSFFSEVLINSIKKEYKQDYYINYMSIIHLITKIYKFDKKFLTSKNIKLYNAIYFNIIKNDKNLDYMKINEILKSLNDLNITNIYYYTDLWEKFELINTSTSKNDLNNILNMLYLCNYVKYKNPKYYDIYNENLIKNKEKIEPMDIKVNKTFYQIISKYINIILENIELLEARNYHIFIFLIDKFKININKENFIFLCYKFLEFKNNFEVNSLIKFYKSQVNLENKIFFELRYCNELDEFHEKITFIIINNFEKFNNLKNLNYISKSIFKSHFYNKKLIEFLIENLIYLNIKESKIKWNNNNFSNFLSSLYFFSKYYALIENNSKLKSKIFDYINDLIEVYYNFYQKYKIKKIKNFEITLAIWSLAIFYEKNDKKMKNSLQLLILILYKFEEKLELMSIKQLHNVYLLFKKDILFDKVFTERLLNKAYKASLNEIHKVTFLNYEICNYLDSLGIKYKIEEKIELIDVDVILLENYKNIIIDIHGYHHFFRNELVLKGNNFIKKKILNSWGYEYIEIYIDEWQILDEESKLIYLKNKLNI